MNRHPSGPRPEHYDRFSDAEFRRRHAAVRSMMAERGLDALIAYTTAALPANVRYLSGAAPHGNGTAYLLFPARGEPLLLMSNFGHVAGTRALAAVPTEWLGANPAETIVARLHDLGLARGHLGLVEVDSARNRGLPSVVLDELQHRLPAVTFTTVTSAVEVIRRVKSEEEIAVLQRSAKATDLALDALIAAARPGATERDLAAAVAIAAARVGGTVEVALIGSTPMADPSMSMPWPIQSNRVLQAGDVILSELSIGYLGYSSQVIRPVALGHPTPLYRDLFDLAAEAYRAVRNALVPGATEKDVQAAAAVMRRPGIAVEAPVVHGWSQWAEAGTYITVPGQESTFPSGSLRLEAGMSVVVEPNPCTPDFRAGIFLGDMSIIAADGAHTLHDRPLELVVV